MRILFTNTMHTELETLPSQLAASVSRLLPLILAGSGTGRSAAGDPLLEIAAFLLEALRPAGGGALSWNTVLGTLP